MNLIETALKLTDNGYSVLPVNKIKVNILKSWKKYQDRLPTVAEIQTDFSDFYAWGVAIVTGRVSGNLLVIDVDCKYDNTGVLWEDLTTALINRFGVEWFQKLLIITTMSGGYHIYLRCENPGPCQKLARRATTDEERIKKPKERVKALIETRGEGGYVVAPPTEGYTVVQKNQPPTVTSEERDSLLEICRSFNEYVEPGPKQKKTESVTAAYGDSPFEAYNRGGDIESLLRSHDWVFVYERRGRNYYRRPGKDVGISGDWWPEKGWFSVFTTSSEFQELTAYKPAAVFCLLECNGDWSICAKKLLALGFGTKARIINAELRKTAYDAYQQTDNMAEVATALALQGNISQGDAESMVQQFGPKIMRFWQVDTEKMKVEMHLAKFAQFLEENGFALYYTDKKSGQYSLIHIDGQLIDVVTMEYLKKHVKNYVNSLPDHFDFFLNPEALLNSVYGSWQRMFADGFIEFFDPFYPKILKDGRNVSYFPFNNGIVKVTPFNIELLNYDEVDGHVWKKQIIDFNICLLQDAADRSNTEFFRFMQCIAGAGESNEVTDRSAYTMRIMGYMLHKYKDRARTLSPILTEETATQEEGGGTGKGLYVQAIRKMRNVLLIDGKSFDKSGQFAYQGVTLDTDIVFFDDVRKSFDFEGLYSDVAEDMTVQKKHKDSFIIQFAEAPKMGASTNYGIVNAGNHFKRRFKSVEFAPFFGPNKSPLDYFGHNMFDDWEPDEWNRFYNLQFSFVQDYMKNGIVEPEASFSMQRKVSRERFGEAFESWFEEYFERNQGIWKSYSEARASFLSSSDYKDRDYSAKRFSMAIQETARLKGIRHQSQRWGIDRQTMFILGEMLPGIMTRDAIASSITRHTSESQELGF